MKVCWLSVSPVAATGYGRETREIVSRLIDKYDITCVAHEADVIVWGGKKWYTMPNSKRVLTLVMTNPLVSMGSAIDILNMYIDRYKFDIIIAHWDAFALEFLNSVKVPYLAYIPIDGPMSESWAYYVRDAYRIIAYSKFGYNELHKFFPPAKIEYIPHGIDTNVFKPINISKSKLRTQIEAYPPIPEDCFLIVDVAANIGSRKQIPLLLKTFKKFAKKHSDVHIYLHSNTSATLGKSYDLLSFVNALGIEDRVHFPAVNPILEGVGDEELCKIYNAADVYVSNSVAEGFGLPILEAQACGTPVIAPRNSAQTELVEGHGLLFDSIDPEIYHEIPIYVPQLTWYPVPDQRKLLEKLEKIYVDEDLREELGKKAREFALNYSWEKIIPLWHQLLDTIEEELVLLRSK